MSNTGALSSNATILVSSPPSMNDNDRVGEMRTQVGASSFGWAMMGRMVCIPLFGLLVACGNESASQDADGGSTLDATTPLTDANLSIDAAPDAALPDAGADCGDGLVEFNELCDDGGENSDDWSLAAHCNGTCSGQAPYCGDTNVDSSDGETCDEGAGNSDNWSLATHCNSTCSGQAPYCGDGIVDSAAGEACDDGVGNSDDWSLAGHCNATCTGQAPYCGDDNIDTSDGEICDDGAGNNDGWEPLEHCNTTCSANAPLCDLNEDTSVTFPRPGVLYPPENQHSDEKSVLGKILFWDQQLSADDTVACGTCHQGSAGGSDARTGMALHPGADGLDETGDDVHGSEGIRRCEMIAGVPTPKMDAIFGANVQVTDRKTPSFLDAMFAPTLFWDGRATDAFIDPDTSLVAIATGGALESQALGPILSPVEMSCEGRTFSDLYLKMATAGPLALATNLPPDMANALCKYPSYPTLFNSAFGDPAISAQRIAFAIATYERTLVSDTTPYDRFVDPVAPDLTALTLPQQNGLALFEGSAGCSECHTSTRPNANAPAQFTNQDFHDLGFIDISTQTNPDLGLQNTTGLATDAGKFRTPTLRNVGLRELGGLIHTGLSGDLEEVMAAYNNPTVPPGPGSNTDPLMIPLGLSAGEIAEIVDFMRNALTDPRVAIDAFPFDHPTLFVP